MTDINDEDPLAAIRQAGSEATRRAIAASMFRQSGGIVFENAEDFELFARELITDAMAQAKKRNSRTDKDPEIFSASEQLNAIKYADENGYITKLEAQRLTRKLLRLAGKRAIANPAAQKKTTTRAKRTTTTRRRTRP